MPMNTRTETENGNDMKTIDIIGWGLFLCVAGFAIGELSYWLEHFKLIPTIAAGLIFSAIVARMGLIKKAPKQKKPQSSKAKKAAQIRRVIRNAQNQNK